MSSSTVSLKLGWALLLQQYKYFVYCFTQMHISPVNAPI